MSISFEDLDKSIQDQEKSIKKSIVEREEKNKSKGELENLSRLRKKEFAFLSEINKVLDNVDVDRVYPVEDNAYSERGFNLKIVEIKEKVMKATVPLFIEEAQPPYFLEENKKKVELLNTISGLIYSTMRKHKYLEPGADLEMDDLSPTNELTKPEERIPSKLVLNETIIAQLQSDIADLVKKSGLHKLIPDKDTEIKASNFHYFARQLFSTDKAVAALFTGKREGIVTLVEKINERVDLLRNLIAKDNNVLAENSKSVEAQKHHEEAKRVLIEHQPLVQGLYEEFSALCDKNTGDITCAKKDGLKNLDEKVLQLDKDIEGLDSFVATTQESVKVMKHCKRILEDIATFALSPKDYRMNDFLENKQNEIIYNMKDVQKLKEIEASLMATNASLESMETDKVYDAIKNLKARVWSVGVEAKVERITKALYELPIDQRGTVLSSDKPNPVQKAMAAKRPVFFGELAEAKLDESGAIIKEKAAETYQDVKDSFKKAPKEAGEAANTSEIKPGKL